MYKRANLHCRKYDKDLLLVDKLDDGMIEILIFSDESRSMSSVQLDDEQVKYLIDVLSQNNECNIN